MDMNRNRFLKTMAMAALTCGSAWAQQQLTIEIKNYATFPITGYVDKTTNNVASLLARLNFLRDEPGNGKRFFVNDMNGPLYILDKQTKKITKYLDFNGRDGRPGMFHKFRFENGQGNGFVNFLFDPDYAHNGKFYTIHLEDLALPGTSIPDNTNFPGLKIDGYKPTTAIVTPPKHTTDTIILEWTDTNISNTTFEGTVREVLRLELNGFGHIFGEISFNPAARPGDPDWRVMYASCGDNFSGESKDPIVRMSPQRLDVMIGKVWRIIPDPKEHVDTSTLSENGQYRIPNDNPFVKVEGARKEIWAYGLRNPTRLTWYVDPNDRKKVTLFVHVIGLHTWETVDIVHKGANYGYSEREGNELLKPDNNTATLPADDHIPVRISDKLTNGTVIPNYPVIQYPHNPDGGDAISGGYVYQGKAIPALRGKYIMNDITTGNIWYTDLKDLIAADDGDPKTMAPLHRVNVLWDQPDGTKETYASMAPVTEKGYHARGGQAKGLPGVVKVAGGRSDMHFLTDDSGEIYLLSKSDGVIRQLVAATLK